MKNAPFWHSGKCTSQYSGEKAKPTTYAQKKKNKIIEKENCFNCPYEQCQKGICKKIKQIRSEKYE